MQHLLNVLPFNRSLIWVLLQVKEYL